MAPDNLTANRRGYRLDAAKEENQVVRLWNGGAGGSEYFLIENRKKTGFDINLPDEGVLIWHISEAESNNTHEWWTVPGTGSETTLGSYLVALEQADGQFEMERQINTGGAGDAFQARGGFHNFTSPGSRAYDGAVTNVRVDVVGFNNVTDAATLDLYVNADSEFPQVVTQVPNDSNPVYLMFGTTR